MAAPTKDLAPTKNVVKFLKVMSLAYFGTAGLVFLLKRLFVTRR